MEDIDGGLHPAVDGQSLDEDEDEVYLLDSKNAYLSTLHMGLTSNSHTTMI